MWSHLTMLKEFKTLLNNHSPYSVYHPGSKLSGVVHVVTDNSKKEYDNIRLEFFGKAHVDWTEDSPYFTGRRVGIRTVRFTGNRQYVRNAFIWKADNANLLSAGSRDFAFSFQLTGDLLPSYEDKNGYIRYSLITAITQRGQHTPEVATAETIKVAPLFKIDTPALLAPFQIEKQKSACCACCASAPIVLTVQLPRRGYCVGEIIPFTAAVENGSGRQVKITALVSRKATYILKEHRKENELAVSNVLISAFIGQRETLQWTPNQLRLPANMTAVSITTCEIMKISYAFKVSVVIPWGLDLEVTVPLSIGNVPIVVP